MRCASAESERRACQSCAHRSSAPSLHARHSTVKPAQKLLLSCSFGHAALPPRIPKQFLRISYLLTSSLFSIWLVCEYHYTRAECLRLNKFECLLLALTMKKPLPVSYYNGEDHETVFINEILLHERVNELNAPKDQYVLTRLLFQSGNFLSNIVLDKGGIPLSFLQRCGWNILGHPVYSFAIGTSSTRPGGCKSLIGDAPQKECIAGKKLIKFICL